MSKQINAKARVQITVEVEASSWGEDCSIGQLYKQAAETAIGIVRSGMLKQPTLWKLVGEPKVIGVITEAA